MELIAARRRDKGHLRRSAGSRAGIRSGYGEFLHLVQQEQVRSIIQAPGADEVVDRCGDLWIVEAVLRLPLELRLLRVDAQDGNQTFTNVLRRQAFALPGHQEPLGPDALGDRIQGVLRGVEGDPPQRPHQGYILGGGLADLRRGGRRHRVIAVNASPWLAPAGQGPAPRAA